MKITPHTKTVIKKNLPYFIVIIPLVIMTIFIPPYLINRYVEGSKKIDTTQQELIKLRTQVDILNSVDSGAENLDEDVALLSQLIPNFEDYFSIIYTLDQISTKTNFLIASYDINLKLSTNEKLALSVTGVGNEDAFLNFLKEYNFGGGRLITAEKIAVASQLAGTTIDLNFYNKKPSASSDPSLDYQYSLDRAREIKNKIGFTLAGKEASAEALTESYPTKSNPF